MGHYHRRISSAYNAQSNGRAEVAVKSAKRLLQSNTGPSGSLDTDRFLHAMMQFRNTPDQDCDLLPVQIVFGKPIRNAFAFASHLEKFTNKNIQPLWRDVWAKKEDALCERFHHSTERRNEHTHTLPQPWRLILHSKLKWESSQALGSIWYGGGRPWKQ